MPIIVRAISARIGDKYRNAGSTLTTYAVERHYTVSISHMLTYMYGMHDINA